MKIQISENIILGLLVIEAIALLVIIAYFDQTLENPIMLAVITVVNKITMGTFIHLLSKKTLTKQSEENKKHIEQIKDMVKNTLTEHDRENNVRLKKIEKMLEKITK